jgi:hypothetical protein
MPIGAFAFGGYDGTSFSTQGKARMRGIAEETWTPTAQGIALAFDTTASGGTTRTEKMRITGNGNVGIATSTPGARLAVNGAIMGTAGMNLLGGCYAINGVCIGSGGATPAGNDKEMQFNDGGAFGAESDLQYDKTLNRISIGGTTSQVVSEVMPLYMAGDLSTTNGVAAVMRTFNSTGAAGFGSTLRLDAAAGTSAAPAATPANMTIGAIAFGGHDGTNFIPASKAQVRGIAEETYSPTSQGTAIAFTTTASGGTTRTEKVRITGNGNVGIGTNNPQANLDVRGSSNAVLQLNSNSPTGTSCIVMKDSDGSGFTYITANDGVLSASQTPCN